VSTLRVFENRALREIHVLVPKRRKVAGGWEKLHNEEFYYQSSLPFAIYY
jgi:hypothetical protein